MEATHMLQESTTIKVPTEHYSTDESEAVFFYGGPFSNFVAEMGGNYGDAKLFITSAQMWATGPTGLGSLRGTSEKITYGADYRTVEHFYQASKADNYDDHEWVRTAWSPSDAKRRGRQVDLRPDWEDVKLSVMMTGLRVKFAPESFMANFLLATGDRYIAEDSPTDFIWGIRDGNGGFSGNNLLGKCLMSLRKELRERQEADERLVGHIVQGSQALATLEAVSHEPEAD